MEVRPDTAEAFLRHADFVRAIARSMLADEHLAEDAAQETWATAMTHSPARAGSLRGWLRTVARHAAGRLTRTRARSRRIEEERAQSDVVPEAAESAARNELLRRVTDELLALREPYRETLLLRYYDGLTVAQIAERGKTTGKTVYSRIQRGLDLLRERLERSYDGDRSAWLRGLALLAFGREGGRLGPRTPVGPGLVEGIVAAACAAVVVGVVWSAHRGAGVELAETPSVGVTEDDTRALEGTFTTARTALPDRPLEVAPAFHPAHLVRGVVTDSAGDPVPGASIWAHRADDLWGANVVSTSDASGAFEFAPASGAWRVGAAASGAGASQLQDLSGDPVHPRELRIELPGAGGDVRGVVRDERDRPLGGIELLWLPAAEPGLQPWIGTLRSTESGYHRADGVFLSGRVPMRATSDDAGRFLIEGAGPGEGELWIRTADRVPLRRPMTVVADMEPIEIVLRLPAVLSGVVRDAYDDPVPGAAVELGSPGLPDHVVTRADDTGAYRFEGVSVGRCRLFASHPSIGAAEEERMLHGGDVTWNVRLEELRVVGRLRGPEGRPLSGWSIRVAQAEMARFGLHRRAASATVDAHGFFELIGCPEQPFTLNVTCDGRAFHIVRSIVDVEPGTELDLRLTPDEMPTARVRGRLALPPGTRAEVAAVRSGEQPGYLASASFWRLGYTDDEGTFAVGGLPAGEYSLMIQCPGRPLDWSDSFHLAPGQELELAPVPFEEPGLLRIERRPGNEYEHFLIAKEDYLERVAYFGDSRRDEDIPLLPGRYVLFISGFGYQGQRSFQVESGRTTQVTLDEEVVTLRFQIDWPEDDPENDEVRWAESWLYLPDEADVPVTGWILTPEGSSALSVPLVVGDYRLETTTNTGAKSVLEVSASRASDAIQRIVLR